MKTKNLTMVIIGLVAVVTFSGESYAAGSNLNEMAVVGVQEVEITGNGTSSYSYIVKNGMVGPEKTKVYTGVFDAKKEVYVYVKGDGETDLDLYIYDENGNLIKMDEDDDDECLCTFTPKWTGRFTIKIKNLGDDYNCYTIEVIK